MIVGKIGQLQRKTRKGWKIGQRPEGISVLLYR